MLTLLNARAATRHSFASTDSEKSAFVTRSRDVRAVLKPFTSGNSHGSGLTFVICWKHLAKEYTREYFVQTIQ